MGFGVWRVHPWIWRTWPGGWLDMLFPEEGHSLHVEVFHKVSGVDLVCVFVLFFTRLLHCGIWVFSSLVRKLFCFLNPILDLWRWLWMRMVCLWRFAMGCWGIWKCRQCLQYCKCVSDLDFAVGSFWWETACLHPILQSSHLATFFQWTKFYLFCVSVHCCQWLFASCQPWICCRKLFDLGVIWKRCGCLPIWQLGQCHVLASGLLLHLLLFCWGSQSKAAASVHCEAIFTI